MRKRELLLLIALVVTSSLAIYLLLLNLLVPAKVSVSVRQLLLSPKSYDGKEVRVEGLLKKAWIFNTFFYNLTDSQYAVVVSSSGDMDLDAYVGLKVLVQGKFRYLPQLLDAPRFRINVSEIQVMEGKPRFFLQFERSGGIAGFQEVFILDNNATASFLSRGVTLWQKTLSPEQFQEAIRIIQDNGFLSIQRDAYGPREGVADFFAYRLKVVLASDTKLKSNSVSWVDEWASKDPLPSNLTRLMAELRAFLASILPQPYSSMGFGIEPDSNRSIMGDYVSINPRTRIENFVWKVEAMGFLTAFDNPFRMKRRFLGSKVRGI
jgi:cytochrome c-type biogenesis protein CcmE